MCWESCVFWPGAQKLFVSNLVSTLDQKGAQIKNNTNSLQRSPPPPKDRRWLLSQRTDARVRWCARRGHTQKPRRGIFFFTSLSGSDVRVWWVTRRAHPIECTPTLQYSPPPKDRRWVPPRRTDARVWWTARRAVACNQRPLKKQYGGHFGVKHRLEGRIVTERPWHRFYDAKQS